MKLNTEGQMFLLYASIDNRQKNIPPFGTSAEHVSLGLWALKLPDTNTHMPILSINQILQGTTLIAAAKLAKLKTYNRHVNI